MKKEQIFGITIIIGLVLFAVFAPFSKLKSDNEQVLKMKSNHIPISQKIRKEVAGRGGSNGASSFPFTKKKTEVN